MGVSLVVVGGGGFGREILDLVRAINSSGSGDWELSGVIDDDLSEANSRRLESLGVELLGGFAILEHYDRRAQVVIGVGSPTQRAALAVRLDAWGRVSPSLIHPSAVVGSGFRHQDGLVMCALASVGTNVTLGRHTHINPLSALGHDTVVGDFVSFNPSSTISGTCHVGARTLVGASSVVLQNCRIGENSIVGAGACVVGDVSEGTTVVGIPARPLTDANSRTAKHSTTRLRK